MYEEAIRRAIQQLSAKPESMIAEGTVQEVNWEKRTCSVRLADGRVLPAVRLRAVADDSDKGLSLRPAKGSTVLVAAVGDETEQCVLLCEEIEAVELKMPNVQLTIEGDKVHVKAKKIELNGGKNGGVPVSDKIASRLRTIENALRELRRSFNSHTHNVTVVGAPTGTPLVLVRYNTPDSKAEDFENDEFTH